MTTIRRLPGIKAMQTTFTLKEVKPPAPSRAGLNGRAQMSALNKKPASLAGLFLTSRGSRRCRS